jgi:hypothetical protein
VNSAPRPLAIFTALLALLALARPAGASHPAAARPPASPVPAGVTDFNGDGRHDLAVGDLNGDAGPAQNAGGVNVLYGGPSGLQTSSPADQYWTANSDGMPIPAQREAEFGFALATGDFNGDGRSDLAIGTPRHDVRDQSGLQVDAGAVYVVYGSNSGLQTASPAAQFFAGNTPGFPTGAVPNALLGRSVIAGDFNGDGYADLGVGAPRQDVGLLTEVGVVVVLYGSSAGLATSSPAAQLWTQDSPDVPDQNESNDWFGRSLGSGNFNRDQYADLVVGAPLEDHEGQMKRRKDSGAVTVLYGSSSGVQATSPAAQFWDQDSHHVADMAQTGDYFGHNLASGDFNADGYDDLAISVRLEDIDGHPTLKDAGAVNVLYGSPAGLQTDAPKNDFWDQSSPHLYDSADKGEQFGFSVAAGDFNNDGYKDLAIGVAFENLGLTVQAAGGVNVLYGGPNGLQTDQPVNQFWTQDSTNVLDAIEPGDEFGFSLAANDFNGDGRTDLAIGVVNEDLEGVTTIVDAGAANVLYGGPGGLQTDAPANQFWNQNSPGMPGDAATSNEFGWWMA